MSLLSWLATAKQTPAGGEEEISPLNSNEDEDELPSDEHSTHPPTETPEATCLKAHQPLLRPFPLRSFGKQQRAFCATWYNKYPWLHYQEADDSVLCFYCVVAEKRGLSSSAAVRSKSADDAFIRTGFSNWKRALEKFEKHQNSLSHRDAMDQVAGKNRDVGEMLRKGYGEQKAENRQMLKAIVSSVRFLGRQGLALRGRYKAGENVDDRGGEHDSNFLQLLKLRADDIPGLFDWMKRSQAKFTSPDIQNEILSIMALMILRQIAGELSGKCFTLMVDETTDLSNTEQMILCLRFVDDDLEVHEEVIGLHSLESTSADTIVSTVQDVLLRLNLRIDNCRGQCYDGASSMSGSKSGVSTRILDLEPRALYTHCYGHALNLATQDALKGSKVMEDVLDTVYEITKLIKKSPKRDSIFKKYKDEISTDSPGIRILCPTRWTVRAEALASIAENYKALQLTWGTARDAVRDTEMRARIRGVAAQMEQFDFFFGIQLGRKLLNIVDNLSRSLQARTISACEGQTLVCMTQVTLQSMRNDESFDLFWDYIEQRRALVDVSSPTLPRRRKVPRRLEVGEGDGEYPATVEDHYRRIYFEAIDLITAAIDNRFQQKGFDMLQKLETILTTQQCQGSETVKEVIDFYGADFSHPDRLETQLTLLHTNLKLPTDLFSVFSYLKSLSSAEKLFYTEVMKVVKLILVMPATNATSERSFSALRRLKTWLRSTTTQSRLNWCMLLHIHKEKTDALQIMSIANEFILRNDSRVRLFGQF